MATYSYLVAQFAFLSHTQGSALEGEKPMAIHDVMDLLGPS